MDPTRTFARLEFNRVATRPLGAAGGAAAPFVRTMVDGGAVMNGTAYATIRSPASASSRCSAPTCSFSDCGGYRSWAGQCHRRAVRIFLRINNGFNVGEQRQL